jgi:anti-sigma factor RsiW
MGVPPFTDEELVAYLDKALPSDRCAEIELMRASDAALQQRLAALEIDVDAIRSAFDLHLAAAPVDDLRQRLAARSSRSRSPRKRNWRWMQLAAALVVGAALGASGRSILPRTHAPDWHVAVAEYQALYTTDTLKLLKVDPALVDRQVQFAATALGRTVKVDNLQVTGLELKRAQVLAFEHQPLIQFAYLEREQTPIAFCAMRTQAPDEPVHISVINGLATAIWNRAGYGYMVIGGTDGSAIQAIAHTLQQHI